MTQTARGQWTSNTDPDTVVRTLAGAKRVVVVTHSKPDGDAAGSALGLVRALRLRTVDAEAWFVSPLPGWLPSIVRGTPVRIFAPGQPMRPADGSAFDPSPEPDVIAVLDTGSWSQLAELRPWLEPRADRAVLIDHHLHGDTAAAAMRIIDSTAAATTQLVAPVVTAILGVGSPARLPVEVAEPLYLGLATDTGWFRHSSVTPEAMHLAGDLLAAGVVHSDLYELIEQQGTAARLRLMSRALGGLRLERSGAVAIMTLRRADFAAAGADRSDTTGFIDIPMTIAGVRVSALVTEEKPENGAAEKPVTKISLRSKPGSDAVDVNRVAGTLGGGGHARAAGARVELPVEQAIERLLEALP
jgi:phosphoesterase RecJ-like protein